MSALAPCPACQHGDHTRHVEHWMKAPEGVLGGAHCGCPGGCTAPDLSHIFGTTLTEETMTATPPKEPHQTGEAGDIRLRLNALADEWERVSGLASPLVNADITSASPAQRTLWEAASELREVLVTWPSGEDEARAWRLRAWASSRAPARQQEPVERITDALTDHRENTGQITGGTPQEPQPTPEARLCCEHCQPDSGEETRYCDRTHCDSCAACAARQSEPVERITDANGGELEHGADTDAQTAQQQDRSDRA